MLANKSPKVNDVIVLRLVSGDEVVGKFLSEDMSTITLGKPICIQLRMIRPGEAGISFVPFMGAADENANHSFYKTSLVTAPMKPRSDIVSNYLEMTTGLAVPTTSGTTLLKP